MKKSLLFALLCSFVLVGCESTKVNPLVGTTYKSNDNWAYSFLSEKQYTWYDTEISNMNNPDNWMGYYSFEDNTIYCYFDKFHKDLEFTLEYCVDSIIRHYDDEDKVYYKQ